ncbi:hypothetical protein BC830DRAFT_117977 [Chytriomyces sp. MP71]|nr:hypothetical protein BC830DRAFT_117977 [Chytriomyces sp. MP71]
MPLNNVQQPKLTSRQSKANALAAFVRADVHAHTVADKRNRDEAGPPQQAPTSLASVPSLPPGVVTSAGADIALRITVSKVVWRIPSSPNRRLKANISLALQSAKVLVDWWGAENLGIPSIALRPSAVSARRADPPAPPVNAKQQRNTDTALFPIISSKSNFCAYLRDMGTLVLRVVNKDNESIGTARIPGLQVVAGDPYSKPITGWYPIMSETVVTHQLGELHFSAVLETFKTQSDTSLPQASRMEAPAIESASRAHSTSPARTQKPRENDAVPKRASTRNLSYQDSNDLKTTVQNAGSASTTSIPLPTRISASSLTTTRKNVGFDKRETQRVHAAGPGNDTGYDSSDGGDSDGGDNYGNYANTTSASHGIYDESAMEIPQTPPLMAAKPDNVSLKRASHVSDPLVGSNQGSNIVLISTRVSSAKVQSSAQSGMEDVSANAENSRQSSSAIPLNHPSSAESIPTQPSRQPSHQSVSSDLPSGQTSQADKDAYEDIYTRAVRLKERISEVSSQTQHIAAASWRWVCPGRRCR